MIGDIRKQAKRFRDAIERCNRTELPIAFEQFPRGSCGDAALLLGTYLIDQGYKPFDYLLGEKGSHGKGDWSSHAWLQRDNLVVDITADQFPEIADAVIVAEDSEWHRLLNGVVENRADFRIYDEHTVAVLNAAYHRILKNI